MNERKKQGQMQGRVEIKRSEVRKIMKKGINERCKVEGIKKSEEGQRSGRKEIKREGNNKERE